MQYNYNLLEFRIEVCSNFEQISKTFDWFPPAMTLMTDATMRLTTSSRRITLLKSLFGKTSP